MKYFISRNQQNFGPYSLTDLQNYVAGGQISPNDMAQAEGTGNWMPVSQILAGGAAPTPPAPQPPPVPPAQQSFGQPPQSFGQPQQSFGQPPQGFGQVPPSYGQVPPAWGQQPPAFGMPGAPTNSSQYPDPPNMNWVLLLILSIVTCGLFMWIWMFIEAAYVSKIDRDSKGMMFYGIGLPCVLVGSFVQAMASGGMRPLGSLIYFGGLVMLIMGHFKLKASIEAHFNTSEPVNLRLSGVMTFFFNIIYFQYHFNKIYNWRRTGIMQ